MFTWRDGGGVERTTPWVFMGVSGDTKPIFDAAKERLAVVQAINARRGVLESVGNAFCIGSNTTRSGARVHLYLTAYHVLREALHLVRPESVEILARPFAPSFLSLLRPSIKKKGLVVCLCTNNQWHVKKVEWVSLNEPSDLALLAVKAADVDVSFPRFRFNSDRLASGMKVAAAAYLISQEAETRIVDARTVERTATFGVQIRIGKIVDITEESRHIRTLTYHMNMPIPGGMSGCPLFIYGEKDHPMDVVGVCVRDFSSAINDTTTAGDSYAVAAEGLHGIFLPVDMPNADGKTTSKKFVPILGWMCQDAGQSQNSIYLEVNDGKQFVRRRTD